MAHYVTAIITSEHVAQQIRDAVPALMCCQLRDNWRLIPLPDEDLDLISLGSGPSASEFTQLTPGLRKFLVEHSAGGPLVYLETEYFGGIGTQAAFALSQGDVLVSSSSEATGPINDALRSIGIVSAAPALDEFDFIGLSRFRSTHDWKEEACRSLWIYPRRSI